MSLRRSCHVYFILRLFIRLCFFVLIERWHDNRGHHHRCIDWNRSSNPRHRNRSMCEASGSVEQPYGQPSNLLTFEN